MSTDGSQFRAVVFLASGQVTPAKAVAGADPPGDAGRSEMGGEDIRGRGGQGEAPVIGKAATSVGGAESWRTGGRDVEGDGR